MPNHALKRKPTSFPYRISREERKERYLTGVVAHRRPRPRLPITPLPMDAWTDVSSRPPDPFPSPQHGAWMAASRQNGRIFRLTSQFSVVLASAVACVLSSTSYLRRLFAPAQFRQIETAPRRRMPPACVPGVAEYSFQLYPDAEGRLGYEKIQMEIEVRSKIPPRGKSQRTR